MPQAPLYRFVSHLSVALAIMALPLTAPLLAAPDLSDWEAIRKEARGHTVYWSAWGGDTRINDYIDWVTERVRAEHEVELVHVKIDDTGSAVSRVLAERSAGNLDDGSVDLVWLNGENFAAMKENELLYGPFAKRLPNFALTHPDRNPEVVSDFTLPTEGFESPWGKAQITFFYDAEALGEDPPSSMAEIIAWAEENPGRFTYPRIPDFLGSTFLKQALIALTDEQEALYVPVEESDFDAVTAPLWDYLDTLHPHLWRSGRQFPASGPELRSLMANGELTLAFTFNPAEPAASVAAHELPPSTRSYVLEGGTLGNVHFVAIPFNSPHKAGAMVVANFLLSPEAQARKQALDIWGDPTVLDVAHLDAETRTLFEADESNPAMLPPEALQKTLQEPHPSWMTALQEAWLARYMGE